MLEHGGKLNLAAQHYQIPLKQWLDLSTGLNPNPWPLIPVPENIWWRLPEEDDGLLSAATGYYGASNILAVAGSQAAIQTLPRLFSPSSKIGILNPAYAEHAHAWHSAGFNVTALSADEIDQAVDQHDVILLVNPNNPTGAKFTPEQCLGWHQQLQQRGGWLIIDEAFIDTTPENSLLPYSQQTGLIVLRSLGKFFGLAGARVGFVFAEAPLLHKLQQQLGPWPVSTASRYIATKALQDINWQQTTRPQLIAQGQRLQQLLCQQGLTPSGGSSLFQWVETPHAAHIFEQLAQQGILIRQFQQPASIRFGLPASEPQWQRLETALNTLKLQHKNTEILPA